MIANIAIPELLFWLVLCLSMVCLDALFSGAESGMYAINMTRVRLEAHRKNRDALRLLDMLRDRGAFLFTTIFGTNLAAYVAPICLTMIFIRAMSDRPRSEAEDTAELYTTLILTPVLFIFAEAVPKNVFNRNADRLMHRFSILLYWSHKLCEWSGVIWLQRKFSDLALRGLSPRAGPAGPIQARLDVYQMLREGAAEGALTLTQVSILERIDRLRSLRVTSVMVPAQQVIMLPADATSKTAEPILRISRVSRLPVYEPGRRRHIIGHVHVLDLLTAPAHRPVRELMRQPILISPDTRVIDALTRLQQESRRMAIVVDQQQRCLGIVTVKDLVEEIVGELKAW